MSLSRLSSLLLLLTLPALLLLALSCGEEEEEEVPAAVSELEDGVLQVGADIAYAPMESFEEGTENAVGLDIDLAKAIAEELGVEAEFINTGWDGIIPALDAERFDVIMSAMTITEEREEQIDFVAYLTAGTGILVEAGNPQGIETLDDLCGKTAAVQVGTIQVDQLEAQNEECEDEISIATFDLNPMAVEQLRLGRADAVLADYPVAAYDAALSEGDLEIGGEPFPPEPYGIGLRKGSTDLKAAIEDALEAIMDSGEYDDILAEWGLEAGSIK